MVGNNNIVVKRLSGRTGKSEEYYTKLINFIFDEVKLDMCSLTGGIFLRKVGTWRLNNNNMRWMIWKCIENMRSFKDKPDTKSQNLYQIYKERFEHLWKLKQVYGEYDNIRREYNTNKYQAKRKKAVEYSKRMEECNMQDSTRISGEEA